MDKKFFYMYSTMLRDELQSKIRGKVNVHYSDDLLFIDIIREGDNINFTMRIDNVAQQIVYGCGINEISKHVEQKYKNYIMNRYFKSDDGRA